MINNVSIKTSVPVFLGLLALFVVELITVSFIFRNGVDFNCSSPLLREGCDKVETLKHMPVRILSAIAVMALLCWSIPNLSSRFMKTMRSQFNWNGIYLHLLGVAVTFIPAFFVEPGMSLQTFYMSVIIVLLGGLMLVGGLFLSSFKFWEVASWIREMGMIALLLVVVGFFSFDIMANLSGVFWAWQPITDFTFNVVVGALSMLGETPVIEAERKIIGVRDFVVQVADSCSGIEGFGLVTFYLGVFLWLFKDTLKINRALLLLPIGLFLSWCLNSLRIIILIMIGANGNPDLAVNGFHSHAGWLAFTVLAGFISYVAWNISWFHSEDQHAEKSADLKPFFKDEKVAEILPFLAFMLATLLISTFTQNPGLYYGVKVLFLGTAVYLTRGYLMSLQWRFDPLSTGAGVLIAIMWVSTWQSDLEPSVLEKSLSAASVSVLIAWIILRLIGTTLLVPIAEELFFRKYLFTFLSKERDVLFWFSVILSTVCFAFLHDRWVVAAIAGVVFALIYLRSNNITDAIQSHMVANLLIGLAAIWMNDWSLI